MQGVKHYIHACFSSCALCPYSTLVIHSRVYCMCSTQLLWYAMSRGETVAALQSNQNFKCDVSPCFFEVFFPSRGFSFIWIYLHTYWIVDELNIWYIASQYLSCDNNSVLYLCDCVNRYVEAISKLYLKYIWILLNTIELCALFLNTILVFLFIICVFTIWYGSRLQLLVRRGCVWRLEQRQRRARGSSGGPRGAAHPRRAPALCPL